MRKKIDDIPTQPELHQYHRRFTDLYTHLSRSLALLKKHYTSFNTLSHIQSTCQKEQTLLESIQDNYLIAKQSKSKQKEFVERMYEWLAGGNGYLIRADGKLHEEETALDVLNGRVAKVDEGRRLYEQLCLEMKDVRLLLILSHWT